VVTSKDAASSGGPLICEERVAFVNEACVGQVFQNSIGAECKRKWVQVSGGGGTAWYAFAMALVF